MSTISSLAIPILILTVVLLGLINKVKIYDAFLEGAKKGLNSTVAIIPPIVGLLSAVYMFRASGAVDLICKALKPVVEIFHIPSEVLPLALLRPVSGSGSIAVLSDILKNYGCDGKIGTIASVLCGSSETTFYTLCVYFGAVGIKNIRYTAKAAVIADIAAVIISATVVNMLM